MSDTRSFVVQMTMDALILDYIMNAEKEIPEADIRIYVVRLYQGQGILDSKVVNLIGAALTRLIRKGKIELVLRETHDKIHTPYVAFRPL